MAPNPFSDGLSVRISASTSSFTAGINRAQDALGDLRSTAGTTSGSLSILGGRADEAGDEISQLGRRSDRTSRKLKGLAASATGAAATFTGLSLASKTLGVSFTGLSSTPLLVILPALTAAATALLSTLFPLAAVAGVAATALGGLFGVVAVGTIAAAVTQTNRLRESFESMVTNVRNAIQPLATAFVPVLIHIMDRIPGVVNQTMMMIGSFEDFQDGLLSLADAVLDALPGLFAFLFEMGERALPIVQDVVEWLDRNGMRVFQGMLRVTRRIVPALGRFGNAFMDAVPALTRLGVLTLEVLVPAFVSFFNIIEDIMAIGADSNGLVDFLTTLVTTAAQWVSNQGIPMIASIGDSILDGIMRAFRPQARGGESRAAGVIQSLVSFLGSALGRLASFIQNQGIPRIGALVSAIVGSIGDGLSEVSERDIQSGVQNLTDIIGGIFDGIMHGLTTPEARHGTSEMGRIAGQLMAAFAQALTEYVQSDAFQDDLTAFADAMRNALGGALEGMVIELNNAKVEVAGQQIPLAVGLSRSNFPEPEESIPALRLARQEDSLGGEAITRKEAEAIAESSTVVELTVDGKLRMEDGEIVGEIEKVVDEKQRQQGLDAEARGYR